MRIQDPRRENTTRARWFRNLGYTENPIHTSRMGGTAEAGTGTRMERGHPLLQRTPVRTRGTSPSPVAGSGREEPGGRPVNAWVSVPDHPEAGLSRSVVGHPGLRDEVHLPGKDAPTATTDQGLPLASGRRDRCAGGVLSRMRPAPGLPWSVQGPLPHVPEQIADLRGACTRRADFLEPARFRVLACVDDATQATRAVDYAPTQRPDAV